MSGRSLRALKNDDVNIRRRVKYASKSPLQKAKDAAKRKEKRTSMSPKQRSDKTSKVMSLLTYVYLLTKCSQRRELQRGADNERSCLTV